MKEIKKKCNEKNIKNNEHSEMEENVSNKYQQTNKKGTKSLNFHNFYSKNKNNLHSKNSKDYEENVTFYKKNDSFHQNQGIGYKKINKHNEHEYSNEFKKNIKSCDYENTYENSSENFAHKTYKYIENTNGNDFYNKNNKKHKNYEKDKGKRTNINKYYKNNMYKNMNSKYKEYKTDMYKDNEFNKNDYKRNKQNENDMNTSNQDGSKKKYNSYRHNRDVYKNDVYDPIENDENNINNDNYKKTKSDNSLYDKKYRYKGKYNYNKKYRTFENKNNFKNGIKEENENDNENEMKFISNNEHIEKYDEMNVNNNENLFNNFYNIKISNENKLILNKDTASIVNSLSNLFLKKNNVPNENEMNINSEMNVNNEINIKNEININDDININYLSQKKQSSDSYNNKLNKYNINNDNDETSFVSYKNIENNSNRKYKKPTNASFSSFINKYMNTSNEEDIENDNCENYSKTLKGTYDFSEKNIEDENVTEVEDINEVNKNNLNTDNFTSDLKENMNNMNYMNNIYSNILNEKSSDESSISEENNYMNKTEFKNIDMDQIFPKEKIEESLKVLNTLQVDIEKVCWYVKHFLNPPENLFELMKSVLINETVEENSKIAIFYVYNHLIQELKNCNKHDIKKYQYIAEIGLKTFVIPVLRYISLNYNDTDIMMKFYRCVNIWNERNVYNKFICDQLKLLKTKPKKKIYLTPQKNINTEESIIIREFSKFLPAKYILQMDNITKENKIALENKVLKALINNLSKETLNKFDMKDIDEGLKLSDKAMRILGQELVLINSQILELSALIDDNNIYLEKLESSMKNFKR